ncbi:hypothetical protein [Streptomyces sp. WAC01280]|uniref:hypothetical protein n=1 Tax=Streptomyces sp. WAC01280 TaxID=2487424 RepID=UPI000F7A61D5|nr:hypothetical protein [Streptomyces sp. WAC01280]RSS51388.1 hypothetical protein EF909_34410 [Streptomyces sp. WAC01280]
MSTVPTPADVFRRKAHPLIAPGPHDPATDEPFRALWELGINGSHLYRHTKLVALLLATHADWTTGHIPTEAQPRLGRLVDQTALHPGQVVVSLNVLEQRGWIVRDDRRRRWNVANVELAIPGPIMRRLKKAGTTS